MKLHDIAFIFFATLAFAVFLILVALNTANAGIADEAARAGVLFLPLLGLTGWGRQGTLYRPSILNSMPQRWFANISSFFRPLCNCHSLILKGKEMIVSFVVMLFLWCRPSAIFGSIRAVVVNAINRMLWGRAWSHISKKVLEAMQPSLTDNNAACSIIRETRAINIGRRPSLYVLPSRIFCRQRSILFRFPMCAISVDKHISSQTSTASSRHIGSTQIPAACYNLTPTIALAQPYGALISRAISTFNDEQSSVSLTNSVDETIGRNSRHDTPPYGAPWERMRGNPARSGLSVIGLAAIYIILFLSDSVNADLGCGVKERFLDDPVYSQTIAQHCDSYLTAQVECKASHYLKQDSQGNISYDFSEWRKIRDFAHAHGLIPRCHALFWRDGNPAWMNDLSPSDLRSVAFGAIDAALAAGARDIELWNEPERGMGVYDKLGQGFIGEVYRYTAQRCPSCTLGVNYFQNPSLSTIEAIDYPVDVIGLESHLGSSAPDWTAYIQAIRGMGYDVYITEFDQSDSNSQEPAKSFSAMTRHAGVDAFIVWNLMPHSSQGSDPGLRGTPFDSQGRLTQMGIGLFAGLGESSNPATPSQPSSRRRGRRSVQPALPSGEQCFSFFGINFCF